MGDDTENDNGNEKDVIREEERLFFLIIITWKRGMMKDRTVNTASRTNPPTQSRNRMLFSF